MKPYRMLILTAATADGREMEAEALGSWAREFYGENVEVKVLHPLESEGAMLGYFGVDWTNWMQREWPDAQKVLFPLIEMAGYWRGKNLQGRREYESTLHLFRPQLIVSLHPLLNRGYFKRAKEILGEDVRCVTYCREWSSGQGLSRHWASDETDRWIGRSEKVVREAYRWGVSPDKLECFPFLLAPPSAKPMTRKGLRLDEERLTILFPNNRSGVINHLPNLQALAPFKNRVQAIVVCGLNEKLRRNVHQWQKKSGLTMILEGYMPHLGEYMQLSDVAVTRGDADMAALAFLHATPLWFDTSHGLMMEEALTVKFFEEANAGVAFPSSQALAKRVEDVLSFPAQLTAARLQLAVLRQKYSEPDVRTTMEKFFAWGFFRARLSRLSQQRPEAQM